MKRFSKRSVRGSVALATVVASIAVAGVAQAQGATLDGETTEGVTVSLGVNPDGTAGFFKVAKSKVECRRGTLSNSASTYRDFDTSAPGSFSGKLKQSSRGDGFTFKSKGAISGVAAADGSWSGTFDTKTKVLKKGRKLDTCKLKTNWTAA